MDGRPLESAVASGHTQHPPLHPPKHWQLQPPGDVQRTFRLLAPSQPARPVLAKTGLRVAPAAVGDR